MTESNGYRLISNEIIKSITTQVKTMRRAANMMNDSDNFQTNAALDNIEGMIIHDTFVCNVSPNYVITENATILAEEVGMEADRDVDM